METSSTQIPAPEPLAEFCKIGHNTWVYTPQTYNPHSPLILLFSWNAAASKHIAKYTSAYQIRFPNARIVLVRSYTPDVFRKGSTYPQLLSPALDVVKGHTKNDGEILVHSFSNGGGFQLSQFAKAWVARERTVLPMRAQMMDSSPGKGGWIRTHAAITESLPKTWFWRWFGSIAVHFVLSLIFAFNMLTRRENRMVVMCRDMNDPAIFDRRAPRVYLYSKADLMVQDEEVEEHADKAEARGWAVKKVRFDNSPHAGHIREDERKYWDAVVEAWGMGPRSS